MEFVCLSMYTNYILYSLLKSPFLSPVSFFIKRINLIYLKKYIESRDLSICFMELVYFK